MVIRISWWWRSITCNSSKAPLLLPEYQVLFLYLLCSLIAVLSMLMSLFCVTCKDFSTVFVNLMNCIYNSPFETIIPHRCTCTNIHIHKFDILLPAQTLHMILLYINCTLKLYLHYNDILFMRNYFNKFVQFYFRWYPSGFAVNWFIWWSLSSRDQFQLFPSPLTVPFSLIQDNACKQQLRWNVASIISQVGLGTKCEAVHVENHQLFPPLSVFLLLGWVAIRCQILQTSWWV